MLTMFPERSVSFTDTDKIILCKYCGRTRPFQTRSGYRTHIRTNHPEKVIESRLDPHWKCVERDNDERYERMLDKRRERYLVQKAEDSRAAEQFRRRKEAIRRLEEKLGPPPNEPQALTATEPVKPLNNLYLLLDAIGKTHLFPKESNIPMNETEWLRLQKLFRPSRRRVNKIPDNISQDELVHLEGDLLSLMSSRGQFCPLLDVEAAKNYLSDLEKYHSLNSKYTEECRFYKSALNKYKEKILGISEDDIQKELSYM